MILPLTTMIASRPPEISAMLPASLANTSGLTSNGLMAPMSSIRLVASASAASVEHVVLDIAGMDDVLCQQGRVKSGLLRPDQQVPVAAVSGVRRVGRMVAGAVVSVDGRPDAEPWRAHELAR